MKDKQYEKAVNKLIHIASDFADINIGDMEDFPSRAAREDEWTKIYLKRMDFLCEDAGLRERRVK